MNLLYRYSQQYWKLFVVALLLAATNQIFSLLDPLIFRHVIDSYATKYHQYTQAQFVRGAGLLLLAAVGVAFVSRVAKNAAWGPPKPIGTPNRWVDPTTTSAPTSLRSAI